MSALVRAISTAKARGIRRPHDFDPTPPACTEALWRAELAGFDPARTPIWEPACGKGDLARVLEARGHPVIATDLIDRGFGTGGVDFLTATHTPAAILVTNPPFSLAVEFIEHAMRLRVSLLALLLKCDFWHAATRIGLRERYRPAASYVMAWRPDFRGQGNPMMNCTWYVWRRPYRGPTIEQVLRRPEGFDGQTRRRRAP